MNYIIQTQAGTSGSRPPIQSWQWGEPPEGFALCPEEFISAFTAAKGFVNIEIENGEVTTMTENTEARLAWEASLPPEPIPEPTAQDDLLALTVDHEYRLTLLELGV
jgi:hypothetical protein